MSENTDPEPEAPTDAAAPESTPTDATPAADPPPADAPASEEKAEEKTDPPGTGEDMMSMATSQALDTLKLALKILPRPTEGIVGFAESSAPFVTSLVLIGLATLLWPLLNWLSVGVSYPSVFVRGVVSLLLANIAVGAVLYLGLKIHFKRSFERNQLLAVFAASLIPFIPALVVGWLLHFVNSALFGACQNIGLVLAALYLNSALRRMYKLSDDEATYFSGLCFAVWTLAYFAGVYASVKMAA